VADAGVEDVPAEFDALGFQLRAGGGGDVDMEGQVGVLCPANSPKMRAGSQIAKQVSPTQNSKRACGSGRRPSVST
jgi:hypothetical protein